MLTNEPVSEEISLLVLSFRWYFHVKEMKSHFTYLKSLNFHNILMPYFIDHRTKFRELNNLPPPNMIEPLLYLIPISMPFSLTTPFIDVYLFLPVLYLLVPILHSLYTKVHFINWGEILEAQLISSLVGQWLRWSCRDAWVVSLMLALNDSGEGRSSSRAPAFPTHPCTCGNQHRRLKAN